MEPKMKSLLTAGIAAVSAGAIAVTATLMLTTSAGAESPAEVDLSVERNDGSVTNASALLSEAEKAMDDYAKAANLELAPEPAKSLCFFNRDGEGFVTSILACGPVLYPSTTTGTYLSVDLDFTVKPEGVTGSLAKEALFEKADFTGSELFRPDGQMPYPTDVYDVAFLNEFSIPREYFDSTNAPIAEKVEVIEREELPGFDGPTSTGEIEFKDGTFGEAKVLDAYIVRSVRAENGEIYTNTASESIDKTTLDTNLDKNYFNSKEWNSGEWVAVELEPGYPVRNHQELDVHYMTGTYVNLPDGGTYMGETEDGEPRTTRFFYVPRDENGELSVIGVTVATDSQDWRFETVCYSTEFYGWLDLDGAENTKQVALNDTPEARTAFESLAGFEFKERPQAY